MSQIVVYETTASNPQDLRQLDVLVSNLDEVSTEVAHGTYAVFRTYPGGSTYRLGYQLDRMRTSAELLNSPFPVSNAQLCAAVAQAYHVAEYPLAKIKLTVPYENPDHIIIAVAPFQPPPLPYYRNGVQVELVSYARQHAKAKDSRFIEQRGQMKIGLDADTYEVMWHDEAGFILEGSSSNFYAIIDDTLYTADEGILEGVARSVVLDVAERFLPVKLEATHVSQLANIQEAMLSSSSRGIMPIVKIGDVLIGSGEVGPYYQRMAAAYHDQIERELETLGLAQT